MLCKRDVAAVSPLQPCYRSVSSLSMLIMRPVAGMLKVPGLMPPRCKMFDTPGVPHAHQLSSRLNSEEVGSFLPRLFKAHDILH